MMARRGRRLYVVRVESIQVRGARENNLKSVDVDIPKRRLTVFTGVSGSGKSSLVFGTIAAEARRLIDETYEVFVQNFMPAQPQPEADELRNLTPAILVSQEQMGANTRSTVGTATDAYAVLRTIFAHLGEPVLHAPIRFSFNDPRGMCPDCSGAGRVSAIDADALVDRTKSLNEGAIDFPGYAPGAWSWKLFAESGLLDPDKKVADYSPAERELLLNGAEQKVLLNGINMTYEGLVPRITKSALSKDVESMKAGMRAAVERIASFAKCPACAGSRLNAEANAVRLGGKSIHDCTRMEIEQLDQFLAGLGAQDSVGGLPLIAKLRDQLAGFIGIGLGYLSLDRPASTLSGGEAQRVKMVRHLGSALTDVTYVFDEPTIGLHPHDVQLMNGLLQQLRDKGNTVLVVEHKPEVMAIADHVVDLGPGAGDHGGEVVYAGDFAGLTSAATLTGRHLERRQQVKQTPRTPAGRIEIRNARENNLTGVDVDVPTGVLVAVTGVAGSGKSSLIHGCLPRAGVSFVDQSAIKGSRRSNPATYTGMLEHIRKVFAKETGTKPALFSANSQGACPDCKGLGVIIHELSFMATVETPCETCEGRQFTAEVLGLTLRDRSIADVMAMSVEEAHAFFTEKPIRAMLTRLVDVGLSYVRLGQRLNSLSGGERQRLKLAMQDQSQPILVLDEPTSGLHMADVDNLIGLLDRVVDSGHTVIVIEHNLDVIARADWIIDLGPGAGHEGGRVVFSGTPQDLVEHVRGGGPSLTGEHLAQR
ncbi:MAG: excinuclease ABC subunit UvrA [Propionibacteriaceae bacterium]|nr:excinuclease ABC subunit UvrA [Propionibacteriaceae bacterium]